MQFAALSLLIAASSAQPDPKWCAASPQSAWPVCDPLRSLDDRAADVVSRISLADKIQLLSGGQYPGGGSNVLAKGIPAPSIGLGPCVCMRPPPPTHTHPARPHPRLLVVPPTTPTTAATAPPVQPPSPPAQVQLGVGSDAWPPVRGVQRGSPGRHQHGASHHHELLLQPHAVARDGKPHWPRGAELLQRAPGVFNLLVS